MKFELVSQGFEEVEGWPSTYVLHTKDGMCGVVVYVDDLLILGGKFADDIISTVRQNIEMEDPVEVNRYLGVAHNIKRVSRGQHTDTTYVFDMVDDFRSSCEIFVAETGHELKLGTTTPAPRVISDKELLALIDQPGQYASAASYFLMKLMYGAGMSAPWLQVPIQGLACHVTKWNAECDRRLKRVYDYIWSNPDLVLTGSLSSEDGEHLSIHCWAH